jgi:cytochrome P450
MGLDDDQPAALSQWSNDLAVFIGSPNPSNDQARRAQRSLLEMVRYLEGAIAAKRLAPGDDMISQLLQAERDGSLQSHVELLAQCAMMLFAGHETTRNLLGNGMLALLRNPRQWQRLRQSPELVPSAVREMLRYDSPVQYTGRRVTTEMELHGQTLRRGDLVIALIGAANRDPERHDDADQLDIERKDPGALAFGSGIHVCIGAALTRLEAEVVFSKLLARSADWQLSSEPLSWKNIPLYRGLEQLMINRRA